MDGYLTQEWEHYCEPLNYEAERERLDDYWDAHEDDF